MKRAVLLFSYQLLDHLIEFLGLLLVHQHSCGRVHWQGGSGVVTMSRRIDLLSLNLADFARGELADILCVDFSHEPDIVLALGFVLGHHVDLAVRLELDLRGCLCVHLVHLSEYIFDILNRLAQCEVLSRVEWLDHRRHLDARLKPLVQLLVVSDTLLLGTQLLGLGPQALVLEVLLPGEAFLSRIFRDESFGILDLEHVVFLLDLATGLLLVDPVLQGSLAEAEALDGRCTARVSHLVAIPHKVVRRHLRAIWVHQGVAATGPSRQSDHS